MNKSFSFLLVLYIILILIIPTAQSAFEVYDTKSFGGKLNLQGRGNVTTNASTGVTYSNATLNGYLKDNGGLSTETYFEYGKTVAYGNTSPLCDGSTLDDTEDEHYYNGDSLTGSSANFWDENWSSSAYLYSNNVNKEGYIYENYTVTGNALKSVKFKYLFASLAGTTSFINVNIYNYSTSSYQSIFSHIKSGISTTTYNKTIYLNDSNYVSGNEVKVRTFIRATGSVLSVAVCGYYEGMIETKDSTYEFSYNLESLLPDTTYHYRAVANNSIGIVNGSDMSFRTSSALYNSSNSTSVEETTATLSSELLYDTGEATTCGFWIGNVSVNASNYEKNVSCSGSYTSGQTFTSNIDGLTSGEYYYVRSWMSNSNGFWNSTNESYFLTKPNAPSNADSNRSTSTSIYITWDNATVGAGTNQSTYIRYSTAPPGGSANPLTYGSLGYNGSGNWTEITGLNQDTTYYFALWTYINASGSPSFWHFSDGYVSTVNATTGGNYTIYVRFENETNGRNTFVNLSSCEGPHKFIIHYYNETDYIQFEDGNYYSTVSGGDYTSNWTGEFNITTDKTIEYIEFHWNNTINKTYRCNRYIIPPAAQRNITFYIRTNLRVYGQSTALFNASLVPYTYSFVDDTNLYTTENGAYHEIYCYNSSGTKVVIDEQFFDTSLRTYPWLVYGKKYYIGVHCTKDDRNRLGFAPTSDEISPDILIPYEVEPSYLMFDLIDLTIGWYDNGFYVDYLDTTGSTVWVNFTVYGYYNHTIIHYENLSDTSNNNFTFECNTSNPYKWSLMCELDSDTNDDYDGIYGTGRTTVSIIPGIPQITNVKRISDIFNNTIGPSPFYDVDDPSRYVPWAYLIIFGIAFMVLTTTAKANAALGTLVTGIVLIFAGGAVEGMKELYAFVPDSVNTVFIVAIGAFLVVIAIVASLGGEDNR